VAIVGAGNLGKALIRHQGFATCGLAIRAVFDRDPALVGRKIGDLRVSSAKSLARVVRSRSIDIGVIAVPEAFAQDVAEQFILAGVRGLLNFSERPIRGPDGVRVQDVRIAASLLGLLCQMKVSAPRGRRRPAAAGSA